MNRDRRKQRIFNRKAWTSVVLALTFSASLPSAWAKSRKASASAVQVVDTLSFDGKSSTGMVLHETDAKSYLYVRLAGDDGIIIVDVTHPRKLKTVSSLQSPKNAPPTGIEISRDAALVVDGSSRNSSIEYNNDQLTLWDISKAGAPRMVQEFHGVKTVVEDERGYIFVLDQRGLSAVSNSARQATDEETANVVEYGG